MMTIENRISLNIFCITVFTFLTSCVSDSLTLINQSSEIAIANDQERLKYLGAFHPENNLGSAIHLLKTYQSNHWNVENAELLSWHRQYLNNVQINALMAEYYLSIDRLDSALLYGKRAEHLGANNKETYLILSLIHSKMGNQGLAIDNINKVILFNRNDSEMYDRKGEIYLGIGDTMSAVQQYELAFRRDSTQMDLLVKLASLHSQMGDINKAKYWIDQMKSGQSNENVDLQLVRVKVLRDLGSTKSADSLLHRILFNGSKDAGIELMKIYKERRQLDSLLSVANVVIEMDSVDLNAMLNKAWVFQEKGYYSSALEYYESVIEKDPQNEEAQIGLGKVNGKIAYLRKLKGKRESIPSSNFGTPSKKLTNE